MHDTITANAPQFSGLPVTMVVFLAYLTALISVQATLKQTKATGLATLRDTKRDVLWAAMEQIRSYIQSLADLLSADGAASLIKSAGLVVAGTAQHTKAILEAILTTAPGTVRLVANARALLGQAGASKKATFNWQWSADGKLWNTAASTPYADTEITGLTPMTTYSFRVSVTVGKTTGAWSQAVILLVTH
jgi:hypothetical protein